MSRGRQVDDRNRGAWSGGGATVVILSLAFSWLGTPKAGAVDVLTQHNDLSRTGANLAEFVLTTSNVTTSQFGKLFSRAVDGQIYAQPLYVHGLTLSNQVRNVVYVCTEHNSVYAFDADDAAAVTPLWQVSLGPAVPEADINCEDLSVEIGITATPVIDRAAGTIYVAAKSKENDGYYHKLHALDLLTGQERPNSPVTVQGFVLGSGAGSQNGTNTFDALFEHNRPGLLLLNQVVYLAYGSHCDLGPYHGWIFGYDAQTLQQVSIYNTTPDGQAGAIWSCGMAPAADAEGNLYVVTGNGTFDKDSGGTGLGDSFIKLAPSNNTLQVVSWFTPHDQEALTEVDLDLGSGGAVLLPGSNRLVGLGKAGVMYLLDQGALCGFVNYSSDTNIVQEFTATVETCCVGSSPVYWNGPSNQFLFVWGGSGGVLQAFQFDGSLIQTTPVAIANVVQGERCGGLSLSAQGNLAGSGIVWGTRDANGGTLHAFDATNVGQELWNSEQISARDALGTYGKFCPPTIANGKVYLGTGGGALVVYGLLTPPYQRWRESRFAPGELADPTLTADAADPDQDGLPNLAEYAFGTDPKTSTGSGGPVIAPVTVDGLDYLAATYHQVLANTDTTITPEVSDDLLIWQSGPDVTALVSLADNGDGTETLTVRDLTPLSGAAARFIRLRVSTQH